MNPLHQTTVSVCILAAMGWGPAGCTDGASGERTPQTSFHLEAQDGVFVRNDEKNPTLVVDEGDRVEISFENTDQGIHHAIAVPSFMEGVREVDFGERTRVRFTASRAGTFQYTCPHHDPVMEGKLVVRSEQDESPSVARRTDDPTQVN